MIDDHPMGISIQGSETNVVTKPHFGSGSNQASIEHKRGRSQVTQKPKVVVRKQHDLSESAQSIRTEEMDPQPEHGQADLENLDMVQVQITEISKESS